MRLAKGLELPPEAVTQTFAFIGKRGGGKTYAAGKLAELMLGIGAQIVVLDPVGTWFGLRVPKNDKDKAFDILVFGGDHGDIDINPKAGGVVANVILDRNISAVIDLSHFIHSEQTRFTYDFMIAFFEGRKKNRSACHIFIEEAQELVPQNLPAGSDSFAGKMLHAGERVVKLGRNFGIGCSLISQRPQEVNKKVLNQTEVLLAFQMTGLQERKTIADWVRDKGVDTDVHTLLPKLSTGEALIWSPTWLHISDTFKINEKRTADVSATPEVGSTAVTTRSLAPVDVKALREAIDSVSAEMEANTPAALKKKIAELSKENRELKQAASTVPAPEPIEVPVVLDKDIELLRSIPTEIRQMIAGTINVCVENLTKNLNSWDRLLERFANDLTAKLPDAPKPQPSFEPKATPVRAPRTHPPIKSTGGFREFLNPKQRKILDTLLTFEQLGVNAVDRAIVAAFAGMSAKGGSFNTYLSALRNGKEGEYVPMIDYVGHGELSLTDAGRMNADTDVVINSVADLHDAWKQQVKTAKQVTILEKVIEDHPSPVTRDELAFLADMSPSGGSFNTYLSGLRSLGIVDYTTLPDGNRCVYATDLLFPDGL